MAWVVARLKRLSLGQWVGVLFLARFVLVAVLAALAGLTSGFLGLDDAAHEQLLAVFLAPAQLLQLVWLVLLVVWVGRGVRRLFRRRAPVAPPAPPPSLPPQA